MYQLKQVLWNEKKDDGEIYLQKRKINTLSVKALANLIQYLGNKCCLVIKY